MLRCFGIWHSATSMRQSTLMEHMHACLCSIRTMPVASGYPSACGWCGSIDYRMLCIDRTRSVLCRLAAGSWGQIQPAWVLRRRRRRNCQSCQTWSREPWSHLKCQRRKRSRKIRSRRQSWGRRPHQHPPASPRAAPTPSRVRYLNKAAAAIMQICYCCLQHRKLPFYPLWFQSTLRMSAADGQAKDAAEEAVTAVQAPPEATDEELERAALLSAWRSRPDDPVSLSRALCRAGPHAG